MFAGKELSLDEAFQEIIRKKPHLEDPLRFYQKSLRFVESMRHFSLAPDWPQTAYARDLVEDVFERFSSLLELPPETLSPLKRAMELGEIDFTRIPLGEIPAFSLPYPEDDLAILLYLLSKPYFLALGNACRLEGRSWEDGKCPVCSGRPAVTWLGEDGRRQVSCSFCGTGGYVNRAGCPVCGALDNERQKILMFEREEGFRINVCDLCRSYVKTVEGGIIARWSAEIADMMSLPLDIVVQEKGYARRSPNPIGMRKITTRG
jgi:FdhE protein